MDKATAEWWVMRLQGKATEVRMSEYAPGKYSVSGRKRGLGTFCAYNSGELFGMGL